MPLPGPPALKDPPPPISTLSTQHATKSGCWWLTDSSPSTRWHSSGSGLGPRDTFERLASSCTRYEDICSHTFHCQMLSIIRNRIGISKAFCSSNLLIEPVSGLLGKWWSLMNRVATDFGKSNLKTFYDFSDNFFFMIFPTIIYNLFFKLIAD